MAAERRERHCLHGIWKLRRRMQDEIFMIQYKRDVLD